MIQDAVISYEVNLESFRTAAKSTFTYTGRGKRVYKNGAILWRSIAIKVIQFDIVNSKVNSIFDVFRRKMAHQMPELIWAAEMTLYAQ